VSVGDVLIALIRETRTSPCGLESTGRQQRYLILAMSSVHVTGIL
jgi:hypothetical protein